MPSFCRHNRLIQNCTICARELHLEARPVVSSSAPKSSLRGERGSRERDPRSPRPTGAARATGAKRATRGGGRQGTGGGMRVRRMARGADDGFASALVMGLRSSEDADALARELAFAAWRLELMDAVAAGDESADVPGLWRQVAADGDIEARTALAVTGVIEGPRGVGAEDRVAAVMSAYASWTARAGSQAAAFTGEASWTPERRFERIFERLSFGRLERDTRFELLTLLGRLGVYELRAGRLFLGGENEPTWAAKRALGIGDTLLLERRGAELAQACGVELEALDLALRNWGAGSRLDLGLPLDAAGDAAVLERARAALGL